MILKSLYLKLDKYKCPVDYSYAFLKKSRCLCNYLEREVLKPLKFRCEGFNRLVVVVCPDPSNELVINSSQVAGVEIAFDAEEYESKAGEGIIDYYAECLRIGLRKFAVSVPTPIEDLLAGIDKFLAQGMKNEWLHQSRTFREHQLKASLLCSLTPAEFSLTLQIWRAKKLVLNDVILRTDPDEIAFEYRFRDLTIADNELVVTSKTDEVLWSAHLDTLA